VSNGRAAHAAYGEDERALEMARRDSMVREEGYDFGH
jgi:hypothetical protein